MTTEFTPVSLPVISVDRSGITALTNVNIDGSCKLSANKILGSNSQEITMPSSAGTLALSSEVSNLSSSVSDVQSTVDALSERIDGMNPALVFDTQDRKSVV